MKKNKQRQISLDEINDEPTEPIDIDKYFADQETIRKRKDLAKAPAARRHRVYKTER